MDNETLIRLSGNNTEVKKFLIMAHKKYGNSYIIMKALNYAKKMELSPVRLHRLWILFNKQADVAIYALYLASTGNINETNLLTALDQRDVLASDVFNVRLVVDAMEEEVSHGEE